MRLSQLTMVNVGPFVGEHVIDFSSLNDSGLFLIEGPTGAGKSTIIDAITFALFGQVAGADGDKSRIRSDRADPQKATEVRLEFSARGRDYILTRTPAYAVPGLKAPRAGSQSLVVTEAGQTTDYRSAGDVGVQIDEALGGIKIDQFRRLVVLPQGEFARLLTASSRENNEILKPLLGDRTIERVQDILKERARAASDERQTANAAVAQEALRVETRARQAGIEVEASLLDPTTLPEVRLSLAQDLVAAVETRADTARAQAAASSAKVDALQQAAVQAERIATMAVELEGTARVVASTRSTLANPWTYAPVTALTERQNILQTTRGRLRPLCDWEAEAGSRMAILQQKAAAVEDAKHARADADSAMSALPSTLSELRAQHVAATADAALEATAAAAVTSVQQAVVAAERCEQLRGPLDEARRTRKRTLDRLAEAVTARDEASASFMELQERQIAQSAARLAANLISGEPCLVCGSCEHPAPAISHAGDLVSDAQVQAAKDASDQARTAADECRKADGVAESGLKKAEEAFDAAQTAAGGARLEDLLAEQRTAAEKLAAAQDAGRRAATLAQRITSTEEDLARVESVRALAAERLASAQAAQEELQQQQAHDAAKHTRDLAELREHVDLAGDTAVDLERAVVSQLEDITRVLAAESRRTEVLARLEGAEPPAGDPATLQAAAEQQRAEHQRQRDAATAETARATDLATALSDLRTHVADLASSQRHHADVVARTHTALRLSDLAAGGQGNSFSMPLSTYAIQLLFEAALDAASRHLLEMSSGQYSLELKEEVSRGHGGLEICVHDAWSGTRRDTQTLSGGERFYASLSLAIGLADVVSAEVGGVQLDTLFIDEGFGSLDPDTLTIVMDQLDRLKSHGRTIGIISHVTELKEHIHDRIEVRRSADGVRSITVTSALS